MNVPGSQLLDKLRAGDDSGLNGLTPALYQELRRLASRHLRGERPDHTLQATALVHEAYLKLFDGAGQVFTDEVHFLAVVSRVMRQVLVDYARARASAKRSAGNHHVTELENLAVKSEEAVELVDLIELNAALDSLAATNEGLARLIEMKYFGGMTAEEIAAALGQSVHIVRHDLRFAQAWMRRRLTRKAPPANIERAH